MMHDQPNNTEYCQGIFDAAQKVVDYHLRQGGNGGIFYFLTMDELIDNLKRALEGKP